MADIKRFPLLSQEPKQPQKCPSCGNGTVRSVHKDAYLLSTCSCGYEVIEQPLTTKQEGVEWRQLGDGATTLTPKALPMRPPKVEPLKPPENPLHAVPMAFRVVQPFGRDKARESTLISEHRTAADAFAEIDRLLEQMVRTAAPSDAVELIVIDRDGKAVSRLATH